MTSDTPRIVVSACCLQGINNLKGSRRAALKVVSAFYLKGINNFL